MLNLEQSMVLDALQRQGRDTPYVNNRGDGNLYNDNTGMPLSRAEAYGSNTRYNQLQNFPRNSNLPMAAMGGGYDTEDYIEQLMYGKPNNIMDMDAVRQVAGNGMTLDDVLANQFGSMSRYNQRNVPNEVYRQPTPKGFGRPYVMSLQEYEQNYLPHYGLNYQDIPQEELPRR